MTDAVEQVQLARKALSEYFVGAAGDHYRAAIKLDPGNVEIRMEYVVNALMMTADWTTAEIEAEFIVNIAPQVNRGWHMLGIIRHQLNNAEGSIAAYGKALELEPRDIKVRLDRANLALDMSDFKTVVAMCDPVVRNGGNHAADALAILAMAAHRDGAHEDSVKLFDRAIAGGCFGSDAAHSNRAQPLLCLGRYKEGWAENEYRYMQKSEPSVAMYAKRFARPMWGGQPAPARIHVHQEMGYGDTFILARYLNLLVKRGYEVSFEVHESLVSLMARSFPDVNVMSYALDFPGSIGLPDFDYHIPMMSLPFMFDTEVDTIPWDGPYLVPPDLPPRICSRRLIGLCWSSALIESSIKIFTYGRRKSMPFETLRPIMNESDSYMSLQLGEAPADLIEVLQPGSTWDDTADAIAGLDLVISVDTGVAHLAAAMGKPVWLLLHNQGTWQWMADRPGAAWNTRSPWYPSVRIFRQQKAGEWGPVIEQVRQALAQEAEIAA